MNRTSLKFTAIIPAIIIALILFTAPLTSAREPAITYDTATDRLSIQASDASLAKVLGRIVLLSGVEIRMDPAVEQRVSLNFEDKPLETGLKYMATRLDLEHAMIYGREEATAPVLLIGMTILPQGGKTLSGGPPPLVIPTGDEASIRTLPATDPTAAADITRARWAERLEKMPPDIREKLAGLATPTTPPMTDHQKKQAAIHQEKQAALKQRNAEKRKEREIKRKEHQEQLDAFKTERPDLYEERLQRQQELLDLTQ